MAARHELVVHCMAEGTQGQWEAICLNFDIAVQGDTFEEVYHSLDEAVRSYLETVHTYPEDDKRRLLSRSVPLWLRLKFAAAYCMSAMFRSASKERHTYSAPTVCPA